MVKDLQYAITTLKLLNNASNLQYQGGTFRTSYYNLKQRWRSIPANLREAAQRELNK